MLEFKFMKTRTKAVVIGGGIAGCSTLYHLTKEGWSDVILLENYLNFYNRWYFTFIKTFTLHLMVFLWSMSKKLYGRFMVDECIVVFYCF